MDVTAVNSRTQADRVLEAKHRWSHCSLLQADLKRLFRVVGKARLAIESISYQDVHLCARRLEDHQESCIAIPLRRRWDLVTPARSCRVRHCCLRECRFDTTMAADRRALKIHKSVCDAKLHWEDWIVHILAKGCVLDEFLQVNQGARYARESQIRGVLRWNRGRAVTGFYHDTAGELW